MQRTGTTSVQKYLQENQDLLLSKGILLPYQLGRQLKTNQRLLYGRTSAKRIVADIKSDIESRNPAAHTVIYSDEDVPQYLTPQHFAPFRDHFHVKVVVVLRRQDRWLESWYLQNVKVQWNSELAHIGFSDFLSKWRGGEFHWLDYSKLIESWSSVFGSDSILPIVFDPPNPSGGPSSAVLSAFGISGSSFPAMEKTANQSPAVDLVELLRHLRLHENYNDDERRILGNAASNASLMRDQLPYVLLDLEERKEVLDHYSQSNAELIGKYMQGDDLFDGNMPAVQPNWSELQLTESISFVEGTVDPFVRCLVDELVYWRGLAVESGVKGPYRRRLSPASMIEKSIDAVFRKIHRMKLGKK
ncbi:hypothetical protein [Halioglobus sp. HI00S01]|uniref:hypothetical protein n=1 Tax=Halioglobus sp. HI00S01 TaxID=1822214 RepID=UPI0012E92CB8|nr:hypothetical protein [Halioglobus sp. HI00S01]